LETFTARPQRVVIGSETRALRLTNFLVDLRRRIVTTSRSLLELAAKKRDAIALTGARGQDSVA